MRRWALATVVLLAAAGCTFTTVKPDQTVVISGRALSAAGAPLRGVTVHLYKEADVGEVIVGAFAVLGSLGSVCLFPAAPAICNRGHVATTDSGGGYRFRLTGAETQGLIGDASTLDAVFADPQGGRTAASTTVRFKALATTVTVPDARLWNAGVHVTTASVPAPAFGVSWTGLPAADGTGAAYYAQLLDPNAGLGIWTQPASGGAARIDARIAEDHSVDVAVTARASLGSGVNAVYVSSRVPVRPIAGAPPSRHRPCFAVTGTSTLAQFAQPACHATDRDLGAPARLSATGGAVVTGAVVDLGTVRRVSLIVGRGLAGAIVVEVSTDGTSYVQVATTSDAPFAISPPGQPAARFVRVRSPSGLDESLLTEISVW
jgi:hypothetical protein